ncbi:hypothetical protein GMLC_10340 [Geomonas limicola]|uniref:GxxExxY protein n=1 Tax=Geomonas limicola TaxID=2740186 RepID=A0A6V8N4I6_9BACT|nr:GxxExxY protein [Geomonas limicola]GFO67455.1 hypothetical protein GMLC_10340 [Geomonas limicola]
MLHEKVTEQILKCFYRVYNNLGFGFLEKVYENALCHELAKQGLRVNQQTGIPVYYEGIIVGDYVADILVENSIILELKAAEGIRNEHLAQLTNYLKATEKELGFVLNFGKKPEFKRMIFTNEVKSSLSRV